MKKVPLLLVVCLFAVVSVFAQNHRENGPRQHSFNKTEMVKMRTDRMAKALGLSGAQKDSLLALNTEFADKMPAMRKPVSQQQMRAKDSTAVKARRELAATMRSNAEEYNKRLKKFLTEEQVAKYGELQKKRMQNRNGRHQMPRQHQNFPTINED